MNSFLKDIYKSKVISREVLEKNLKNWKIGENQLNKTFQFPDFRSAMTFVSFAQEYLTQYEVNAKISNVYNKVEVSINENLINNLTTREFKAAIFLDEVGGVADPVEDVLNTNYYISHHAFPERYAFENAPTPTDPFKKNEKYLLANDTTHNLRLL